MSAETAEALRVATKRFQNGHGSQEDVKAAQKAHDADEKKAKAKPAADDGTDNGDDAAE